MAISLSRFVVIVVCVILFVAPDVRSQLITINNNLVFGAIFPGVPKTITKYTAGAAAEFQITGTAGSELAIDFALPTYMVTTTGFNIAMVFQETDVSVDNRAIPDQSIPQKDNLNPWQTILDTLGASGTRIWLGGQAIPRQVQPPGSYSATIVLTVTYTGN